jgi:dihydroorotate dehydrogenase electron transfer subunit
MMKIKNIIHENPSVKTFFFEHDLKSQPGQFVMLWIPGVDQKPFSIAYDDGKQFGLSIFAVGPLSKRLFELKVFQV